MNESKCKTCGKWFELNSNKPVAKFCSRACYLGGSTKNTENGSLSPSSTKNALYPLAFASDLAKSIASSSNANGISG